MALNQYGIDSRLWAQMAPEDQNAVIQQFYSGTTAAANVPTIGGYVTPTPQQVQTAVQQSGLPTSSQQNVLSQMGASPQAAEPNWVFAVNMPSTYPDFAAMKAAGSGIVVVADDPNADTLVAAARQAGIPVAIQVNAPAGITPQQYANNVAAARARWTPDRLVLDVEAPGKGYAPGDPRYDPAYPGHDWSDQAAPLIQAAAGGTALTVTMEPNQDDYNYAAYTGIGADVWVQAYQGPNAGNNFQDMTPVDPDAAAARVAANGVDPTKITVIVGPNQTSGTAQHWASFGIPNTKAGGVYATTPQALLTPVGGNTTPAHGPNGGPAIPGEIPESGPNGGPTPPGSPAPPGSGLPGALPDPTSTSSGGTTTTAGQGLAASIFAGLGLPADIIAQLDKIFAATPDVTQATALALAYIRGTPWYGTHFPGITEGRRAGLVNDERDYLALLNQTNQLYRTFLQRDVTTGEFAAQLVEGVGPDTVGKRLQGFAFIQAYGGDIQYAMRNFGEGGLDSAGLKSLGEQESGLSSTSGTLLEKKFQDAQARLKRAFEGVQQSPALQLDRRGKPTAPSFAPPLDIAA